jgi:hypothetical protein
MNPLILKAHYDGREIRLDAPCDLSPNAQLLVTVLPSTTSEDIWRELAKAGLGRAYGDDEPDYPLSMVAEPRPE